MADISHITLPNSSSYDIKDANALHVTGTAASGKVPVCQDSDGTTQWTAISTSDTKVTQTASTTSGAKPVLMSVGTSTDTTTTVFDTDVTVDPGTGTLDAVKYTVNGSDVVATKTASGGWLWSTT